MKNIFLFISSIFLLTSLLFANDLKEVKSTLSVEQASTKLQKILQSKKVKIFAIFDHSKEAKNVNLALNETKVIVFGNPKVGTKLMQCEAKIALELPLKMLIYKNDKNETIVSYKSLKDISRKYDIKSCGKIVDKLSNIQEKLQKALMK